MEIPVGQNPGEKDVNETGPPELLSSASSALVPLKDEPPNGGLHAWLQVLGAFFMYFNTWGKLKQRRMIPEKEKWLD